LQKLENAVLMHPLISAHECSTPTSRSMGFHCLPGGIEQPGRRQLVGRHRTGAGRCSRNRIAAECPSPALPSRPGATCSPAPPSTAARPGHAADRTVRIGVQKYGTLIILRGRKLLEPVLQPLGWSVSWHEFPGGPQLLEALTAGVLDFGTTGEAPPIFAQAARGGPRRGPHGLQRAPADCRGRGRPAEDRLRVLRAPPHPTEARCRERRLEPPFMTIAAERADILWFLPTHGDGRYLGTELGPRHVTLAT